MSWPFSLFLLKQQAVFLVAELCFWLQGKGAMPVRRVWGHLRVSTAPSVASLGSSRTGTPPSRPLCLGC